MRPSTKRLVLVLEACDPSAERDRILDLARADRYNDVISDSATPIIDLVMHLTNAARRIGGVRAAQFFAIAEAAKKGEFDAGREEWAPGEPPEAA